MKFSGNVLNGTQNKCLDFGSDLDHCLDHLGRGLCSPSALVRLFVYISLLCGIIFSLLSLIFRDGLPGHPSVTRAVLLI